MASHWGEEVAEACRSPDIEGVPNRELSDHNIGEEPYPDPREDPKSRTPRRLPLRVRNDLVHVYKKKGSLL